MTLYTLITKSLWYFRKQHMAVFAGTMISTAVLTGALIIGDSVSDSLKKLVDFRLGKTKFVLATGSRFVRADLASEISSDLKISAVSMILLQGIAINSEANLRINKARVIGVDSSFWLFSGKSKPALKPDEAMVSENVAKMLKLKPGDEFLLRVENASIIPVNAPFVPESKPSVATRLKIISIVNDSCFGRFSLQSNQTSPFNIFVSRRAIAEKLDLKNMSNGILFSDNQEQNLRKEDIEHSLSELWHVEDAGLTVNKLPGDNRYEIVSNRVFIDEPVSKAILNIPLPHETILTYLVNSIRFQDKSTPYSFVSAASPPIVPQTVRPDEIIINTWLSDDLGISEGDSVTLDYYVIGPLRTLSEKSKRFVVKQIITNENDLVNRSLMPSFPGLADAGSCRDWNTGIPIDLKRIREKDEKYWDEYRGTPKALISLETGVELWSNQFGNATAIRFDAKDITLDSLKNAIVANMSPSDIGLVITPVQQEGLHSATNGVDFGELFLSLSFFIIAAAVLLTILLHTLNTELRSVENGVLAGLGLGNKRILRLRFTETFWVVVAGGMAGAGFGILYQYGLIAGLNSVWNDAVRSDMLNVSIHFSTLFTGAASGIIIALLSVFLVTRRSLKRSVSMLVKGGSENSGLVPKKRMTAEKTIAWIGTIGAIILVGISLVTSSFENAGLFLSAGALFLTGSSMFVFQYLIHSGKKSGQTVPGLWFLAIKNAGRNKRRSVTVILVLAIGTFSIILTGSYRKTFYGTENLKKSGTGGFLFWMETSSPVIYDLNGPDGKKNMVTPNDHDLDSIRFIQIQSLEGDDASCLNLNQVQRPRILGIPAEKFDERKAFSFSQLQKWIHSDHPWKSLDNNLGKNVFPAFADQTVITYGMKKAIGDTITYKNEVGDTLRFVLAGGLDNSVFQGNLLISDKVFGKQFPSSGGSKLVLIDADPKKGEAVSEMIRNSFADYGVEITKASDRLAEFNSVENTYLTVFMVLGGLGILIGTIGMGVILYRNMLERRRELGVFMALGFKKKEIFRLVFFENIFLLAAGVGIGISSAFIGILPSLLSPSFFINTSFLYILISIIFLTGGAWIWFLVRTSVKTDMISLLRNE